MANENLQPTEEESKAIKYFKQHGFDITTCTQQPAAQLKREYKKLALEFHPDKNPPEKRDECGEAFKALSHHYEVLEKYIKRKIEEKQETLKHDYYPENPIYSSSSATEIIAGFFKIVAERVINPFDLSGSTVPEQDKATHSAQQGVDNKRHATGSQNSTNIEADKKMLLAYLRLLIIIAQEMAAFEFKTRQRSLSTILRRFNCNIGYGELGENIDILQDGPEGENLLNVFLYCQKLTLEKSDSGKPVSITGGLIEKLIALGFEKKVPKFSWANTADIHCLQLNVEQHSSKEGLDKIIAGVIALIESYLVALQNTASEIEKIAVFFDRTRVNEDNPSFWQRSKEISKKLFRKKTTELPEMNIDKLYELIIQIKEAAQRTGKKEPEIVTGLLQYCETVARRPMP